MYSPGTGVVELEIGRPVPQRFAPLVEQMDRTRKVDSAYRRLLELRDEDRVLKLVPVVGKYRTLLFDFPWQHEQNIAGLITPSYI